MFDVVAWMTEHGHPSYEIEINEFRSNIDLIKGEAGPDWQFCPFTMDLIKHVEDQIERVREEAEARYDDWKTDALP